MGRRKRLNVYFGENSIFRAVKDRGKPGVDNPVEVIEIAAAQLADLYDFETVDKKTGRKKPFSIRTWLGRCRILDILDNRTKSKVDDKVVDLIRKVGIEAIKLKEAGRVDLARKLIRKTLEMLVGKEKAEKLLKITSAEEKALKRVRRRRR